MLMKVLEQLHYKMLGNRKYNIFNTIVQILLLEGRSLYFTGSTKLIISKLELPVKS